jgi:3'-phosphoadenosine 5'-phosphosulfate sulfotransferase (PAPS reductase)/FAD synthetase
MNAPIHPLVFKRKQNVSEFDSPVPTGASPEVAITDEVRQRLDAGAAVAVGVSGGKDSQACAIAVAKYLDQIGHTGPRLLIHADLGIVEWKDSLPCCQRLAEHLGWELVVVRRAAGDMMERWEGRWRNNVKRYNDLSCVKLILPWSTPALRFCTSDLKASPLASELRRRFKGMDIVSVAGIRRQESSNRAKMPVSKENSKLKRKGTAGLDWNAIIEWTEEAVYAEIAAAGLALHEGYTKYGMTRISCAFCIMGSIGDLISSAACEDNRWLADVAPHLLPEETLARVARAKELAKQREAIEAELPEHLLYEKGWPKSIPTWEEAELIASIRRRIAGLLNLPAMHLDALAVIQRYQELMALKQPCKMEAAIEV